MRSDEQHKLRNWSTYAVFDNCVAVFGNNVGVKSLPRQFPQCCRQYEVSSRHYLHYLLGCFPWCMLDISFKNVSSFICSYTVSFFKIGRKEGKEKMRQVLHIDASWKLIFFCSELRQILVAELHENMTLLLWIQFDWRLREYMITHGSHSHACQVSSWIDISGCWGSF